MELFYVGLRLISQIVWGEATYGGHLRNKNTPQLKLLAR